MTSGSTRDAGAEGGAEHGERIRREAAAAGLGGGGGREGPVAEDARGT